MACPNRKAASDHACMQGDDWRSALTPPANASIVLGLKVPPLPTLLSGYAADLAGLFENLTLAEDLNATLTRIAGQLYSLSPGAFLAGSATNLEAAAAAEAAAAEANSASAAAGGAGTRPGLAMREKGYRAKHPVVIVPGFISSGLELWDGQVGLYG